MATLCKTITKSNPNATKMNQKSTKHGPKIVPKSVQNRPKIGPKSVQNRPKTGYGADFAFEFLFGPILVPFWLQLGAILGAKLRPCWAKNRFLEGLEKHQKTNMIFNTLRGPLGTDFFGVLVPKSTKNRSRSGLKSERAKKQKSSKNHWFFNVFWGSGGSEIDQKSIKIAS